MLRVEENEKQIDGCIKVFSLIKLLLQGNATYSQVTDFFLDDAVSRNSNSAIVTMSKYINTLKVFGINVVKDNKCYKILNPPYKIDISQTELDGFLELYDFLKDIEGDNFNEVKQFMNGIKARFSEKLQININRGKSKNETDFSFYYSTYNDKIKTCKRLCVEKFKLEIRYYKSDSQKETIIQATPDKLIYSKNKIRLRVINIKNSHITDIPINKILYMKQLTSKNYSKFPTNNVVIFELNGRLAENYTPRSWEYMDSHDDKGNKLYINKGEDESELLSRVLKYRNHCKIKSPQEFKEMVKTEIDKMLELYKV